MPLITSKVLSNPTRRAWAQIHEFMPDDARLASHGEMVAVIGIEDAEGQMAVSTEIGKEILTRLNEEYFGKNETVVFERLLASVKTLASEFPGLDLAVVAAVLWRGYIYFCTLGKGQVWLSRGENLYPLVKNEEGVTSLSGKVQSQDVFLLGTSEFFEVVGESLAASFSNRDSFVNIADSLAPQVHRADKPKAACVFFRMTEEENQPKTATKEEMTTEISEYSDISVYVDKIPQPETSRSKAANIITFFGEKARVLARKLPESPRVYISDSGSRRKAMFLVGLLILVLLGVSVVFGMKQKKARDYKMRYQDRLIQSKNLFESSLAKKDVSPNESRDLFLQGKSIVETLQQEGFKDPEIDKLAKQIGSLEANILGRVSAKTTLFLDLSVVRSGVVAKQLVLGKNKIVVLDSGGSRLISTSTDKKETVVVGGADKTPQASFVTLYSDKSYTLADKGIIEISKSGTIKTVVAKDDEWGEVGGMGVFGGNLYILTKNGKIWRYPAIETGFGAKQDWFAKDVSPDFSKIIDSSIDGSVWILANDGTVGKFTRGARDNFKISGFDQTLSNAQAIYTDDSLDSVFVLDKGAGAIMEFDKKGAYKLQYVIQDAKDAVDLVVSKEAGKIFLLTETKILEIPLKLP